MGSGERMSFSTLKAKLESYRIANPVTVNTEILNDPLERLPQEGAANRSTKLIQKTNVSVSESHETPVRSTYWTSDSDGPFRDNFRHRNAFTVTNVILLPNSNLQKCVSRNKNVTSTTICMILTERSRFGYLQGYGRVGKAKLRIIGVLEIQQSIHGCSRTE